MDQKADANMKESSNPFSPSDLTVSERAPLSNPDDQRIDQRHINIGFPAAEARPDDTQEKQHQPQSANKANVGPPMQVFGTGDLDQAGFTIMKKFGRSDTTNFKFAMPSNLLRQLNPSEDNMTNADEAAFLDILAESIGKLGVREGEVGREKKDT